MEIMLAQKLSDMDMNELITFFTKLKIQDRDAYNAVSELLQDEF